MYQNDIDDLNDVSDYDNFVASIEFYNPYAIYFSGAEVLCYLNFIDYIFYWLQLVIA